MTETYGYYRGVGGYWVWKRGKIVHVPGPRRAAENPRGIQVIKDLEPYKNVIDGRVIGGRKQHRDFLKAHGCIEVGTEKHNTVRPREEKRDPHLREQIKAEGRRRGMDWV